MRSIHAVVLGVILGIGRVALAIDPPASEVAAAFPDGNGLAVQVGATSPAFVGALTNDGKRLVHALATDDKTRDEVRAGLVTAKVHPLATVATWLNPPHLPYADRFVNLLIIDRDALGAEAPTLEECRRVVAPGGAILARSRGAWTTERVTRPSGWGNWTHFDGGADGNAVSSDSEANGIRSLQWIDNVREARWFKTGPKGGDLGSIRVQDRYAVIDMHVRPIDGDPKFTPRIFLECRDVNNGLPLWRIPRAAGLSPKRWSLAVGPGVCLTWLKIDGPLTAIDLATGKELRSYPGSEVKPYDVPAPRNTMTARTDLRGDSYWVRLAGTTVLANGAGPLQAWTLDGKPLWKFGVAGNRVEFPVVDEARGTIYALLVQDRPIDATGRGPVWWGRWPNSRWVNAIVAIDLATGKQRWRNDELASRDTGRKIKNTDTALMTAFGQLLPAGDHLVAFNGDAIGGGQINLIASLDAATGKTVHFDPAAFDKPELGINAYNAVYRDGLVYIMNPSNILSFDPKSGEMKRVFNLAWNGRCAKPIATKDNFLVGQTAFLDKTFGGPMYSLARSGCANSPVPGAGVIVFAPHTCSCVTHLDGYFATSARSGFAEVPARARLVKGTGVPTNTPTAEPFKDDLLAQSWPWFTIAAVVNTAEVEKAGWKFRVDPLAHRLDAVGQNGKWSYYADARIATDFVVSKDTVVIGSHDGWVHAINLQNGALRWRYLVAPGERLITANGLLTSSWPVFGVAELGDGQVVASAGTHAELDGGIRVVGLDVADGNVAWVKNLSKKPTQIGPRGKDTGGKRGFPITEFSLINAAPVVQDGRIIIDGGRHLNRLEFLATETEQEINARLLTQKRR